MMIVSSICVMEIFELLGPIKQKLDDNKKISKEDNKALKQIAFKAKRLYAIERAERQVLILSDLKASIPIWGSWGGPTIIFDTETLNVSHGQQIRFGVAQVRGLEYHELAAWIASGRTITRQLLDRLRRRIIFYNAETVEEQVNDIPAAIALLQSYADKYGYELLTQEQFITDVFLRRHSIKGSVIMPVMVIGQNLPFDISAITGDGKWGYSQGEMYGGFTFNLHGDKTEDVEYPRLRIKKIGFAKHMFKFSPAGWVEYKQNGYHFIDIPQLARAVLGAGTPASMKALCRMFTIPLDKEEVDYGSKLYIEFVDYVCNDVERTWRCYQKLRAIYEQHERSRMNDKIYSEASLGKSYLDDTGVVPFIEGNIDKAIDAAHKSKMLQLCGVSMEAMYGARAEGHCRHEITECMVADFKSQYPTICTLLGLVDLMVAERIDVVVNDPKDEAFLRNTTIEDILSPDQACRETVWLTCLFMLASYLIWIYCRGGLYSLIPMMIHYPMMERISAILRLQLISALIIFIQGRKLGIPRWTF